MFIKPEIGDTSWRRVFETGSFGTTGKMAVYSDSLCYQSSATATSSATHGAWHHVAFVADEKGNASIFVDYVPNATACPFVLKAAAEVSPAFFVLGSAASGNGGTYAFNGKVACLRVSDAALGADDLMRVSDVSDDDIASKRTLGLWNFLDGVPGTAVSSVTNAADAALRYAATPVYFDAHSPKTSHTAETFPKPVFAADAPYVVDPRASGAASLVDCQAVRFFNDPDDDQNIHTGFQLTFPRLSGLLSSLSSATLEFFVKWEFPEGRSAGYWRRALKGYYQNARDVQCYSTGSATDFGWRVNCDGTNQDKKGTVVDSSKWCHAAFVKDNGRTITYVDGMPIATNAYTVEATDGTLRDFFLGANGGDANFVGEIAALRVTAGALEASEFLKAVPYRPDVSGTAILLDFKEGAAGASVASVTNAIDGLSCGAPVLKGGAAAPVYSQDTPGAYIYAGRTAQKPISVNPLSVDFGQSHGSVGSALAVSELGTYLGGLDAFTAEFFFKINAGDAIGSGEWLSLLGLKFSGTYNVRVGTIGVSTALLRTRCPAQKDGQFALSAALNDGKWHHCAVTYDKTRPAGEEMRMLLGYAELGSRPWTNDVVTSGQNGWINANEAGNGSSLPMRVSCFRVTPRALSAEEMLIARKSPRGGLAIIVR